MYAYKIGSVLTTLFLSTSAHVAEKIPSGLSVHSVPLRRNDVDSPWAYAASVNVVLDEEEEEEEDKITSPYNFLATQVWPSARYAAATLEGLKIDKDWKVCEFGCGPALPSLTLAKTCRVRNVVATDIDPIALEMVRLAADQQGISFQIKTQIYDLLQDPSDDNILPDADLYILSDVFESANVAIGAARLTCQILASSSTSRVWVFAQSDRVQRDSYLQYLKQHQTNPSIFSQFGNDDDDELDSLQWKSYKTDDIDDTPPRLWLCDIDETKVSYC